ncbi:MAG: type II toxin-antitoxin system death-on-curing family toxin [Rhodothermaceae bacterium]|nr:type II toxin-antitoxin system death-on-curing family toxin [Rhodothermaceae bacterium]MYC05178.1 type II toxin-antitoxin system death-on-curing family toxin [Rhodothermaceae bacterium]MYI17980.1 type II toxin-antitoxin system death-on-curing family toxin [Rhodothermaceae bacterium]
MCNHHYHITWDDEIDAHDEALVDGGAPGILNEHAIRSALARPYHGYFKSLHEKVAALMHGIISNHGFIDGNKRTAFYLAELLIRRSGCKLLASNDLMVDMITSVARGEMTFEELTEWLREQIVSVENP